MSRRVCKSGLSASCGVLSTPTMCGGLAFQSLSPLTSPVVAGGSPTLLHPFIDEVLRRAVGGNPCLYVAAALMLPEHSQQFALPDGSGLGSALAEATVGGSVEAGDGEAGRKSGNLKILDRIRKLSQPPFSKSVADWALCLHRLALLISSTSGPSACAMTTALYSHVGTVLALALDPAKTPPSLAMSGGPDAVWVEYDRRARNAVERLAQAGHAKPWAAICGFDPNLWNDAAMTLAQSAPKARVSTGPAAKPAAQSSKLSGSTVVSRGGAPARTGPKAGTTGGGRHVSANGSPRGGVCSDYNTIGCNRPSCRFMHLCGYCNSRDHGLSACKVQGQASRAEDSED